MRPIAGPSDTSAPTDLAVDGGPPYRQSGAVTTGAVHNRRTSLWIGDRPATRNLSLLTLAALLITGCVGASATRTPEPTASPAFDVSRVVASFRDECQDPAVVDALFCEQVTLDGLSVQDGTILLVPTTLDPQAEERGSAICEMLALAHFDAEGVPLGYDTVGILGSDGSHLAACSVV